MSNRYAWVFNGDGARFPSGVFSDRAAAEQWIARNALSGVLTAYPLDKGVYDWVIENGYLMPKKSMSAELVGRFSSAYQEHYHYVRGVNEQPYSAEDTSSREPGHSS